MASGYTTYNSNGTVKSFTPAATYKAQNAADIAAGRDTAIGVAGRINQNITGTPTAATSVAPGTINSSNINDTPAIVIPTPKFATNINTNAMTAMGAQNSVAMTAQLQQQEAAAAARDKDAGGTTNMDFFNNFLATQSLIPEKPSVLEDTLVQKARNEKVAQQNQLNQDTALLNAVITKQNQDLISTRGTASANGVTEAVYGGIQNEINRNAALQSLPIAAKIAVDQGNLELAQENLEYMTAVVTEKITNAYEHQVSVYKSIENYVNKTEARLLDEKKTAATNNFTLQRDAVSQAADYIKLAIANGQGAIVSGLMKAQGAISNLNTASPTYAADLKSAQASVATFAGQLKSEAAPGFVLSAGQTRYDAKGNVVASRPEKGEGGGGGGIVGGTSPQSKQYAGVLNTILGSGKFTKDQAKAITNAINNGEDAFAVVKNQAKTLLGQTGDTKLTSYEVAREQLTAVKDSLKQYYALGGKTNIFAGNYEKVINKLGEVSDPKLVSIAVEIASSLQIYRNAVSGTAYSVQEGVDIASIFPGINKSQGLNEAILAGRAKAFDSTIDSTYRSVLGKSYDELKALNSPASGERSPAPTDFASSTPNYTADLAAARAAIVAGADPEQVRARMLTKYAQVEL